MRRNWYCSTNERHLCEFLIQLVKGHWHAPPINQCQPIRTRWLISLFPCFQFILQGCKRLGSFKVLTSIEQKESLDFNLWMQNLFTLANTLYTTFEICVKVVDLTNSFVLVIVPLAVIWNLYFICINQTV